MSSAAQAPVDYMAYITSHCWEALWEKVFGRIEVCVCASVCVCVCVHAFMRVCVFPYVLLFIGEHILVSIFLSLLQSSILHHCVTLHTADLSIL